MIKTYLKQLKDAGNGLGDYIDIIMCTLKYGASPNNYRDFGFKNLSGLERSTYVTNGLSRKIIKKFNNSMYIDFFEDKTKFAKRFFEYFGREWISTSNLDYSAFVKFAVGKEKFIYKPIENAQGQGIIVFDYLQNLEKVYDEISNLSGEAILEEWIEQHQVLGDIYSKAINCLRVITFYRQDKVEFLAGG